MIVPVLGAAIAIALLTLKKPQGYGDPMDVQRHVARLLPYFPEMALVHWHESHNDETYIREKINAFLCTRNGEGIPYDDNIMTYVILHELAHGMQTKFGHGQEWMATFYSLLDRAIASDLLNPSLLTPQQYCRYQLLKWTPIFLSLWVEMG